ncbi:hypothetical protein [Penaeicola halotolerans]|uniref:hypothetical protein n=1 Tax=Penaeicola halotolerans TaxID=2793196 RepID=UPI001CF819FE|nr:hypothetical protein [Penaeicola halotolerans]
MDQMQGLLCGLTNAKADFQDSCISYQADDSTNVSENDDQVSYSGAEIDSMISPEMHSLLSSEQRLFPAILVGLTAGFICSILWAAISVATGYQIGYMAIAVGAAVGFSMRYVGKGIDQIYGIMGGAIAFISVLLGNFLVFIGFVAESENLGYLETILVLDYSYLPEILIESFSSLVGILFYGLAVLEGYKFAFRKFTKADIESMMRSKTL